MSERPLSVYKPTRYETNCISFFLFQRHGPSQYGIEAFNSSLLGLVIISKEKPVVIGYLIFYLR